MAERDAFQPGDIVAGRYRIEACIRSGSRARTFRAMDRHGGPQVAIKAPPSGTSNLARWRAELEQEAATGARFDHPHVLRVHGFSVHKGVPFIVTEHISGGSLDEALRSQGALDPGAAVRIALETLSGLAHVHAHGVVHCDLAPQNILFKRPGITKVCDFGLSQATPTIARVPAMTAVGMGPGTPAYMAPENARRMRPTVQTDIFACGAILYHMITGRTYTAFPADDAAGVRDAILYDQLDPLGVPGLDHIELVIRRALEKRPEDRFPDAKSMRNALWDAAGKDLDPARAPA